MTFGGERVPLMYASLVTDEGQVASGDLSVRLNPTVPGLRNAWIELALEEPFDFGREINEVRATTSDGGFPMGNVHANISRPEPGQPVTLRFEEEPAWDD